MIIVSDTDHARRVAEDIGELQRAAEAGQDVEQAGDAIVVRLDALMRYFGESGNTYTTLVEPVLAWSLYSLGPRWIDPAADPQSASRYRALHMKISDLHERYKHLDPDS